MPNPSELQRRDEERLLDLSRFFLYDASGSSKHEKERRLHELHEVAARLDVVIPPYTSGPAFRNAMRDNLTEEQEYDIRGDNVLYHDGE